MSQEEFEKKWVQFTERVSGKHPGPTLNKVDETEQVDEKVEDKPFSEAQEASTEGVGALDEMSLESNIQPVVVESDTANIVITNGEDSDKAVVTDVENATELSSNLKLKPDIPTLLVCPQVRLVLQMKDL